MSADPPAPRTHLPSVNLRLSDSAHQLLVLAAKAEGVSLSQYIREAAAARAYIERRDGELYEVWQQALTMVRKANQAGN